MIYLLKKSQKKGKRFKIIMPDIQDMIHHFGSDIGKTFVDHGDIKKKQAWIARHKTNKNWDNPHAGIYYSRHLLWGKNKDLASNIRELNKKDKVHILNMID